MTGTHREKRLSMPKGHTWPSLGQALPATLECHERNGCQPAREFHPAVQARSPRGRSRTRHPIHPPDTAPATRRHCRPLPARHRWVSIPRFATRHPAPSARVRPRQEPPHADRASQQVLGSGEAFSLKHPTQPAALAAAAKTTATRHFGPADAKCGHKCRPPLRRGPAGQPARLGLQWCGMTTPHAVPLPGSSPGCEPAAKANGPLSEAVPPPR